MRRRDFLNRSAAGATFLALPGGSAVATAEVPPSPDQLRQRGERTIYRKSRNELRFIGMPAGGHHAGTVYLGGDGRLWLWNIFNRPDEGVDPKNVLWQGRLVRPRDGSAYVDPAHDVAPLEQGLALHARLSGRDVWRRLRTEDWPEIAFEATYPIATVRYVDESLPLTVSLDGWAPFIPLDDAESSLPVTIQSVTIRNKGADTVDVTLHGWLENIVGKLTGTAGTRVNSVLRSAGHAGVAARFRPAAGVDTTSRREAHDVGSMCLFAIGPDAALDPALAGTDVRRGPVPDEAVESGPLSPLLAGVSVRRRLAPGEAATVHVGIAWHFPNVDPRIDKVPDAARGHHYAARFTDAAAVAAHVARHFDGLRDATRRWQDTWHDSTLPSWFMERSLVNVAALSTGTSLRFGSGRYWA